MNNCRKLFYFVVVLLSSLEARGFQQNDTESTFSGIAFEIIVSKLEYLQDKLIETDEKLSGLEQKIDEKFEKWQNASNAMIKQHQELTEKKLSHLLTLQNQSYFIMTSQNLNELSKTINASEARMSVAMEKEREYFNQTLSNVSSAMDERNKKIDQELTALGSAHILGDNVQTTGRENLEQELKVVATKLDLAWIKIDPDSFLSNISLTQCKSNVSMPSGMHIIMPKGNTHPFVGYCEQSVKKGGWLVIQRRFDGSLSFNRNWTEYRKGFGAAYKEYWLGLEHVHQLTSARRHELLIEMKDFNGTYKYAMYDEFEIGSEDEQYVLKKLGAYSGTAGDSLVKHQKGRKFSTADRDNDEIESKNCASEYQGGWWYSECYGGCLNGMYTKQELKGFSWYHFSKSHMGLAYSRMMIREV